MNAENDLLYLIDEFKKSYSQVMNGKYKCTSFFKVKIDSVN